MRGWGAALVLLLLAAPAAAQHRSSSELAQAKEYFRAGASAYEMGDYLAAIQALAAAYRVTPLPAIAFSLAQAERRQYFASRDRAHLDRAIELYRIYLSQVATGGRRADATDALAQLEPLAALSPASSQTSPAAVDKTRLMISSPVRGAVVALDGSESMEAPVIREVTPGMHRLRVSAPGYFDLERDVEAVAGELIPVEVPLRERPATVSIRSDPEAELHVDGTFAGRVSTERRLELGSGSHVFSFARTGYEVKRVHAELPPGTARRIDASLLATPQRRAAIVLFVIGGSALGAGAVLTGLAIEREDAAQQLEDRRTRANITPAELSDYSQAKRQRDRLRIAAGATFAVSLASAVTGLFLYAFDEPDLREPAAGPELRLTAAGPDLTVTGRFRF